MSGDAHAGLGLRFAGPPSITLDAQFSGSAAIGPAPFQSVPVLSGSGPAHIPEGGVQSLIILIDMVLNLYMWLLIASAILSWLVAFNVINTRNRFVYAVGDFLYRITEPVLRPIRRVLPNFGGIDLSPVVLILLLIFVRNLLWEYAV